MARIPSYPKDAAVGAAAADGKETAPEPRKGGDSRRTKHIVAGAAIGIGSAAIVAALLYANRKNRS